MKTITLITLLVLSNITFSQNNNVDSLQTDSLELFYILDSYWSPPNTKTQETDDSPNYFQVSNGIGLITGRIKNSEFYFYGEVKNLIISIDEEGNKITSFYLLGKERSVGKIASFEIIEKSNGEIVLNYYSKYRTKDNLFYVHIATSQEITDIKNYWKDH